MPFANVCCKCRIVKDDFNRANSDDPGEWTEVGGSDYDIDSNELLCATAGLLIHDTPHPDGDSGRQHVHRKFKLDDTTQHARIVVGYADANNYLYASVEQVSSCWVLRLFQVVSGTPTELVDYATIADGVALNEWHLLEVCLSAAVYASPFTEGDIFRASVKLSNGRRYALELADVLDLAVGDQVGLDDSADVRTDDFYFGYMESSTGCRRACPDCLVRECTIESDDFTSEVACKWEEVVGNPTISGGTYNFSGAALTVLRQGAQRLLDAVLISGNIGLSSGTEGTIRFLLGYLDADNYLFGEVVLDADGTSIRIGQKRNGNESYLASEEHTNTYADTGDVCLQYVPGDETTPTDGDTEADTGTPDEVTEADNWTTPNNVLACDTSNLSSYTMSNATLLGGVYTSDQMLVRWNTPSQFTIPAGSTIRGVRLVCADCIHDGANPAGINAFLDLLIGTIGSDTQGPIALQTSGSGFFFGGEDDTMGMTLVAEDILNAAFLSASVTFSSTSNAGAVSLDCFDIAFYYTTPDQEEGVITFTFAGTTCTVATGFAVGKKAGIESVSGAWEVDDVLYTYAESDLRPGCPECDCPGDCVACTDAPLAFKVVITGISDGSCNPGTSECGDFNGTHICDQNTSSVDCNGRLFGHCHWNYNFPDAATGCCPSPSVFSKCLQVVATQGVTGVTFGVGINCCYESLIFPDVLFLKVYPTAPNCGLFDDESIPFSSTTNCCGTSSPTCTLTAL